MMKKRISQIISISLCCIFLLSSCGKTEESITSADITLLDPVTAMTNTEPAIYRSIYNAKVYAGSVYPYLEEYSFDTDVTLERINTYLGEEVRKGTVLAEANDDNLAIQIENMEKTIADMKENYLKQMQKYDDQITELEETLEWPRQVKSLQNGITDENLDYTILSLEKREERIELQKNHTTQLYEIDLQYYVNQLAELNAQERSKQIIAGMDGTVVAIGNWGVGSYIAKDEAMIAVSDQSSKVMMTDYLSKRTVVGMSDIYAIANGKRYEVTYQPYDSNEYNRRMIQGESLYSTFLLEDENNEVQPGDYIVLVAVSDCSKDVLAVPRTAIHKNETGEYVYVVEHGENVVHMITTGYSDGTYTEVSEGIEEGDQILLNEYASYEGTSATVTRGTFDNTITSKGYLAYLQTTYVKNPAEYGTTYFKKYLVTEYSHVSKGDVLAEVYVVRDDIALYEKKTRLERLISRTAALEADTENIKANTEQIEAQKKEIAELQQDIQDMESSFAVTQIVADRDGIVLELEDYEQDSLVKYNDNVVLIAEESTSYIVINNESGVLNINQRVTLQYQDENDNVKSVMGRIANVSAMALSSSMNTGMAFIQLSEGDMATLVEAGQAALTNPNARVSFYAAVDARTMPNVLLVPKKAVHDNNGQTYIYEKRADGTVVARSFIAGGSNDDYYWVAEGLEEGMILCLE